MTCALWLIMISCSPQEQTKCIRETLNRSVSRVLGISLVADGSCNGRNPDLPVVVLNCLIFGAFQSFTLPALIGSNRSDVFHCWNLIPILMSEDCVVSKKFVRIGRQMVH